MTDFFKIRQPSPKGPSKELVDCLEKLGQVASKFEDLEKRVAALEVPLVFLQFSHALKNNLEEIKNNPKGKMYKFRIL